MVADLLTGGTLTAPVLGIFGLRTAAPVAVAAAGAPLSPAVAEARAAGAVLGEQITGATAARDIAARRDLVRVGILGAGALDRPLVGPPLVQLESPAEPLQFAGGQFRRPSVRRCPSASWRSG